MNDKYVLFDWAIKRVFRDKEHFGALEGFLTELLEREVKIVDLLESESNQEDAGDKQNRVDLLARLAPGRELVVAD